MTTANVCIYSPYAYGGHPRYVAELMGALAEHCDDGQGVEWVSSTDLDRCFYSDRYEVHAVLPPLRKRSEFRTGIGWAASRASYYFRRDLHFLIWLRKRPNVGAVHFQESSPAIAHLLVHWLKKRDKAVFFTVHNVRPHSYPRFLPRSTADHSLRTAYAKSDCLFVHSEGLATELEQSLKPAGAAPLPRIRVVHHGIWSTGGKHQIDGDTIVQRLEKRRLLCFGNIRRNKGLHLLLEAAARHELEGFSITVAGPPLELDYFKGTVLPLVEQARMAGVPVELIADYVPDDDIALLFAGHSAIVLPYTEEFVAQSGVAFMALAHGLPIVASAVGGLGELMSSHCIGVTVGELTSEALAEAIHQLFATTDLDVERLVGGMQSATDELSWHNMAAVTAEEYRRAATKAHMADSSALSKQETNWST